MILTVTYDKTSGDIILSSDISSITVSLNDNATIDTDDDLSFEVAIDTSSYEQINELPTE